MVWTCSLIRPRSRSGSLCVKGRSQQSRPNMKHGFAAQGSSDWTRRGGRDIQTQIPITTENLPFGISLSLSLWNTSSVWQEVINCSNTNWNNPQPQASPYTWPWKLRCCEANFSRRWCDVVVVVVDRSVGVKALDCSFERLWFNRQFLLSLQSNIPQCELVQSLSSTITWLRPFLILPPSSPLLLVSFR